MATEGQITVNYTQAKTCASELEDEADKLKKLADSDFAMSIAGVQAAWKGENAELYIKKCEQLKEEMLYTAKSLTKIASSIRSNAKAIYDAEMENLRLMQKKAAEAAKKALEMASPVVEAITNTTSVGKSVNSVIDKAEAVRTETNKAAQREKAEEVMEDVASIAKNIFNIFR